MIEFLTICDRSVNNLIVSNLPAITRVSGIHVIPALIRWGVSSGKRVEIHCLIIWSVAIVQRFGGLGRRRVIEEESGLAHHFYIFAAAETEVDFSMGGEDSGEVSVC